MRRRHVRNADPSTPFDQSTRSTATRSGPTTTRWPRNLTEPVESPLMLRVDLRGDSEKRESLTRCVDRFSARSGALVGNGRLLRVSGGGMGQGYHHHRGAVSGACGRLRRARHLPEGAWHIMGRCLGADDAGRQVTRLLLRGRSKVVLFDEFEHFGEGPRYPFRSGLRSGGGSGPPRFA